MINAAICEDYESQALLLKKYISEWALERNIGIKIDIYENADAFLFQWEDNPLYDILVLDVEMPGAMNGMDLAKALRGKKDNVQIIFATGNCDFVFDGYSVDAVDYIVKPVKKEKLFKCLDKAYENSQKEERYIIVDEPGAIRKLPLKDICYIESTAHDTSICTINGCYRSKKSISHMEQELQKDNFIRIHRSYLVNVERIQCITKKDVMVDGGQTLPIARGKWEAVNMACLKLYRS